jgi:hypothetical protein
LNVNALPIFCAALEERMGEVNEELAVLRRKLE